MKVPVNEPVIAKNASVYVQDCLKSGWVSSGEYVTKFEKQFSKFIGTSYGVTTTSGTTALHLALASLGIGRGDEVIIPDLTIISCALAVLYLGAKPVMVDVDENTGIIDPAKIEAKITKRTKAIMVVHLYGHPADLDHILVIAKKYKLFVIEDAAQAHGAEYKGKRVGGIGDVGCFSFYGNKIVTTGEGGMVVTSNKKLYEKAKSLRNLAHDPRKRFLHNEIGYNYRMTNLQAALGVAQLEEINTYIAKKRWIAAEYENGLKNISWVELPVELPFAKNVYWMYAVRIMKGFSISRDKVRRVLTKAGIDTREFFIPLHKQPILQKVGVATKDKYPVSTDLAKRGFYLPSGLAITKKQIAYVVKAIKNI